ncbi:MAG: sigma-54-dependent Fis family transcriptional regulator [Alphaproteobacteria bacterium]|nr:sigma-54-dependent Fis family transcriptional regulator [Alphaproteobacteria bacterium]
MGFHVWVVEDTKALNDLYCLTLSREGYQVTSFESGSDLLDRVRSGAPCDVLVLDVHLPDIHGLALISDLKTAGFRAPVVVITGYGSIALAVSAMQAGACDFLVKPFSPDKLIESTQRALMSRGLGGSASPVISPDLPSRETLLPFHEFIGTSLPMQTVYEVIQNVSRSQASVFITGESGTGKDIAARAIHHYSPRAGHKFVAINCAAIPRDLMESELFGHVKGAFTGASYDRAGAFSRAHHGTLFLDEICDMDLTLQSKLLRVIQDFSFCPVGSTQEQQVNLRVICASNKDPLREVKAGHFREDLYYRLHVVPMTLPPLRDRGDDILDLADFYLARFAREEGKNFSLIDPAAEDALRAYAWPGNVRELMNVIRQIVVMRNGPKLMASMLPPVMMPGSDYRRPAWAPGFPAAPASSLVPLRVSERRAIETVLSACGGNIPQAAGILEISPSTLYRKKAAWDSAK